MPIMEGLAMLCRCGNEGANATKVVLENIECSLRLGWDYKFDVE